VAEPFTLDDDRVDHFRARFLADVISECTGDYWRRRGLLLLAARHRPGIDFPGRLSDAEHAARNSRLESDARACMHRASLERPGLPVPAIVVAELLRGVRA